MIIGKNIISVLLFLMMICLQYPAKGFSDIYTWQAIFMNEHARNDLRQYVRENSDARRKWLDIQAQAEQYLKDAPSPVAVIHYEGLLNNHPDRVKTVASLMDMRKLAHFYYAWIITREPVYQEKIKEYVVAWTNTYQATGNPINENKLEAIYLTYYITRENFTRQEQEKVDGWIGEVADAEINRQGVPMNNWQTKRIKLLLYSGIILNDESYKQYALQKFREYINHSLRSDGSSYDLEQRDALAYHVSGLKPLILLGIVYDQFKSEFAEQFNPFTHVSANKSSIKKSVDFVNDYATGKKQHREWVNSKVKLDHERAKAGLAEYQKGKVYEPAESLELYEQAMYFEDDYQKIIDAICLEEQVSDHCHGWMYYVVKAIKRK
ncbi:hypothetical protein D770_22020 [Flammeovirgaceae bacterium 311]|nr:hypothetical protein D770_22020 [Flammeovirgaceae bacterium 311]